MEDVNPFGTLYVVATPIGNLQDMTFRAVDILKQVDLIAAEDTRHSLKLLSHYGIQTRLVSCHEHNEAQKIPQLITQLKNGRNIALISDAGTPTISDPGYQLVTAVSREQIPVIPIPGCSAAIAGLSVSGLPTDAFLFMGFMPRKQQKLQQALEAVKPQRATLILYESPRRIMDLVAALLQVFGDRAACLTREITKRHEEYIRGTLSEISKQLNEKETIKGECALFVQGNTLDMHIDEQQLEKIIREQIKASPLGTAALARQISDTYHFPRKQIYDMILRLS